MFTVNANDFEKFKTDEYVPIPEDSAIDSSNVIAPSPSVSTSLNISVHSSSSFYSAVSNTSLNSYLDIVPF